MRAQMKSALPLTVALTVASAILTVVSASQVATAATNCLPSPKGAAPDGSHWYYRTDRTLQRKCWYLASEDRDAAKETAPAAPQSKPAAKATATRQASMKTPASDEVVPPSSNTHAASAKEAVDVAPDDALVILPPPDAIEQQPAATTAPVDQAQAATDVQAISPVDAPPAEQPAAQQAVAANSTADAVAPANTRVLQFVFLALAVIGLLGGAILYIAEMRRRRVDVLNIAPSANTSARKVRVNVDGPAVPLSPAKSAIAQPDEVDQALERLAQLRRRQAA